MKLEDISIGEYDAYYGRYIRKLSKDIDLRKRFVQGKSQVFNFFEALPMEKWNYRYAPEKWNIKEVFQHMIDTERIFIYRCFRIARNDSTALSGFDQDIYVEPSGASQKSIEQLINEYATARDASISLINSLSDSDLQAIGKASGGAMSARAAAAVIVGHEVWHMEIIEERYL